VNFFQELSAQGKAVVVLLLMLLVVAVGANFIPRGNQNTIKSGVEGSAEPGYTVIFRNMEPQTAGEAAAELKERGIDVHIVNDGTAVSVPSAKADEARIKLALKGLPKAGDIGFSQLFGDKPNSFISTDFEKKVAFNRALNGELARLVRKIDGVDSASVLINMPEDQLFTEERKPTTASVMVRQSPNKSLGKAQVEGIQHLVASSVPGLKTNNVTVVNDQGKLLSDGMTENAGDVTDRLLAKALDRQMMLTHERESAIEVKVQSLLDKMYGPGKSVVRVAVDLDFTQKKTKTRLFAPPADGTGRVYPANSTKSTEKSNNGGATQGNITGVTGNLPRLPGYPLESLPNQGSGSGGFEKTYENTQHSNWSMNDTLTEEEIGTVKRMSVTALIQGLSLERVPALVQIVAATAGADVGGRGDQIVVQPVAFDTSQTDMLKQLLEQQEQSKTAAASNAKKKDGGIPTSWIIGAAVGFVVLFLLLALVRMASRREDTTDVLVDSLGDPGMPPAFDPNALAGFAPAEMTQQVPEASGGDSAFGFLEQIDPNTVAELLMQERPATAAAVLGTLNPGYADMVLSVLPPEMQDDLMQRIQGQPTLPAFQQRSVAQQLRRRLGVPV